MTLKVSFRVGPVNGAAGGLPRRPRLVQVLDDKGSDSSVWSPTVRW